jgi:hypothetical protein
MTISNSSNRYVAICRDVGVPISINFCETAGYVSLF